MDLLLIRRRSHVPANWARRGFTLIELMIVVSIIGILAAIAIPKFADMIRKSQEGATLGALGATRSALNIYVADNEGAYPGQGDIVHGNPGGNLALVSGGQRYLASWPVVRAPYYHPVTSFGPSSYGNGPWNVRDPAVILSVVQTYENSQIIYKAHATDGTLDVIIDDAWLFVSCSHTDSKGSLWYLY